MIWLLDHQISNLRTHLITQFQLTIGFDPKYR